MTTSTFHWTARCFHLPNSTGRAAASNKRRAFKTLCLVLPLIVCTGLVDARAGSKEFISGSSLTNGNNYTPAGVPAPTDNIVIDSGSPTGGAYTVGAALNVEDLSFSLTTTTSIAGNSATANTLELNGGRGSSVPLIDENSTKKLTFNNGSSSALNMLLGVSGAFEIDNSGGLTVNSNIGQVNAGTTLTISGAGSGVVTLSGTDSFSGGLNVIGAEVDVTSDTSLGSAGGSVTINGGRLGISGTFTLDPTRNIYLGANPSGGNTTGTISISGSTSVITINQGLQNVSGSTGDLVKQGSGTLQLGGASSYSGNTFLNNGITQLVAGNNRLPVGTTVSLGQAASANAGELDLNGFSQQIAGLNSTNATTKTPTAKNTVTTSTGSATLTLGGSGTYAYGDGTATNSGVITGAISILKTGTGTQTFGDNNTYSGSTTISGGTLVAGTSTSGSSVQALGGTSGVVINNGGTLMMGAANQFNPSTPALVTLNGAAASAATFAVSGNSQGSTTANGVGALTLTASSVNNIIDFGSKNGTITFASLTTNGAILTINNYLNNNATSGGPDELIFNQNESGNLQNIVFTGFGSSAEAALGSGFYEVFPTPVPEPATVLGGALMFGALGWGQRRRIGAWMAALV